VLGRTHTGDYGTTEIVILRRLLNHLTDVNRRLEQASAMLATSPKPDEDAEDETKPLGA
jgi:hypothetical protein